jgi:hypothetical protein
VETWSTIFCSMERSSTDTASSCAPAFDRSSRSAFSSPSWRVQ